MKNNKQLNCDLKVIINTAYGEYSDEKAAYEVGAYDFIKKPISYQ